MKMLVMLLVYAAITAAALALLYDFLRCAFPAERKWRILPLLLVGAWALFPPLGAVLPDAAPGWFFQRWGNVFLGFTLYFFGPLTVVWLLLAPVRLVRRRRGRAGLPRGWALSLLLVLLAGSVLLNVLGLHTARDVVVTRYAVPKETLGQTDPLRIVLIGDLHIGVNSSPALYADMVEQINRQEPDLVLVAGDIVTSSYGAMGESERYASVLRGIRAAQGVYVVYGNHDMDEPLLGGFSCIGAENAVRNPAMPDFLERCGWTLLTDETVTLPERNGLVIAGRRDESRPGDGVRQRASPETLLEGVDPAAPVILLQHEPSEPERLGELGVDLALSGHTHDGQVFPGNLITRAMLPQSYGQRQWGSANVIVTSGVGFYGPPIRVGTVSEIVVIDVQ